MVTKFTRKELECIGRTEEEIKMVMEYQRKLPFPDNDFEMSARTLHNNLNVGRDFSAWITGRIKKYNFTEHVDYKIRYESSDSNLGDANFADYSKQQLSAMGVKKEYYITLTMAKELCTIENNDIGRLARRYFILMESIVRSNKEWIATRNEERLKYKPLCEALSASLHRISGRYGDDYDFAREANILNVIATGAKAQDIKNYMGMQPNELTRDGLTKEFNERILFLQEQDILLLGMDIPVSQRVDMLIKMFDVRFPNSTPLFHYKTREDLLRARENLKNELACI